MTDTRSADEIEQFEQVFRINIGDIVDQYYDKHEFFVEQHKPTWRNILSRGDENEALFNQLEDISDNCYHSVRNLFRVAHNLESQEGIKLSKEFQAMTDKTLATINSYENVHGLVNHLNKYAL